MSYDGCPSVKLKTKVLQDLFPNDDCILVSGDDSPTEGAMSTPALYDRFAENPCHLCGDGIIRRYLQEIGTIDDIEIERMK